MQQQRGLTWRRRALERRSADTDDRPTPLEVWEKFAQPLRAGDRVELVALGQPGRGIEVVVGTQRHDEDIGLMHAGIGGHTAGLGVDRGDRLTQETHTRLDDHTVGEAHRVQGRPAKHHVELGVPKDERVVLVDQGHFDLVAKRLRESGRQLKAAKASSKSNYASLHSASITRTLKILDFNCRYGAQVLNEKEGLSWLPAQAVAVPPSHSLLLSPESASTSCRLWSRFRERSPTRAVSS